MYTRENMRVCGCGCYCVCVLRCSNVKLSFIASDSVSATMYSPLPRRCDSKWKSEWKSEL